MAKSTKDEKKDKTPDINPDKTPANTTPASNSDDKQKGKDADFGKLFENMMADDLAALKRGVDEIRSYANSAMSEGIRIANAFQQFHYMSRDGQMRDDEQDKRIKEGAKERGAQSIKNLRMYFRRIEEELRGLQKTF